MKKCDFQAVMLFEAGDDDTVAMLSAVIFLSMVPGVIVISCC